MISIRTGVVASAALALSLALVGCGGGSSASSSGGSSAPSSAPAIAKADFLTQGNAICKTGNAAIAAIGENVDTSDQAAVTDALTQQVLPNVQGQIEALKALGYPDGDQATLDGIYSEAESAITSLEQDPSPMINGTSSPFDDVNTKLTDYGLTECGTS